ncbi:heat shock factor protein HSF24-like [Bidens hawaiensis]|uniref:heat shock factor protein HSF24-like n=1 Tax=Bidens hawaiensis TaxID=980011 RepID=UPI00404B1B8C
MTYARGKGECTVDNRELYTSQRPKEGPTDKRKQPQSNGQRKKMLFSCIYVEITVLGFRKIVSDRWEFANDYFIRGEKSLLQEIRCRKIVSMSPVPAMITGIPISTSSKNSSEEVGGLSNSPTIATCTIRTDLYKENERLKEHNSSLRCELDHLRSMCCNVVAMLSNFNATQPELGVASGPMVEEETCPRLFGVS